MAPAGVVRGKTIPGPYRLLRCGGCGFAAVAHPPDPALVYTDEYYRGAGADPLVDYAFEAGAPGRTIRRYEWRGIAARVAALAPIGPATRWLDAGCGTGGLVAYLREHVGCDAMGQEEGWALERLRLTGIPVVDPDALAGAARDVRRRHRDRGDRARGRPGSVPEGPARPPAPGRPPVPHHRQRRAPPRRPGRMELRHPRDPRQLLRAAHAGAGADRRRLPSRVPRLRPGARGHHSIQGAEERGGAHAARPGSGPCRGR